MGVPKSKIKMQCTDKKNKTETYIYQRLNMKMLVAEITTKYSKLTMVADNMGSECFCINSAILTIFCKNEKYINIF